MSIYRQGDVLIQRIRGKAKGQSVQAEQGRLVLAHGEVTGHTHSVPESVGTLTRDGDVQYLTIDQLTAVEHEEHAPIPLTPGVYRVTRQSEYAGPARSSWVGD